MTTSYMKRICTKIQYTVKAKYVLTFTWLSISVQAVASTTAAGSGLVAATQEADMGTSSRLSIWNCFTRVTPDCGQMRKGQPDHYKPMKHPLSVPTQTPACESQDEEVPDTHLHMLTYIENVPYLLAEWVCGKHGVV